MLPLLALLAAFSSFAGAASTYPIWAQCSANSDCVAIPGLCREWDYVNRESMEERLKSNAERRKNLPCVGAHVFMTDAPVAACFHGLCTNALDIAGKRERCPALRERMEFAFTMANTCEEHEDCERGLASCAENCEFRVYPKKAKASLAAWQARYTDSCAASLGNSPDCKKVCVDPTPYVGGARGVRCVEGKCTYPKLRERISR